MATFLDLCRVEDETDTAADGGSPYGIGYSFISS